MFKKYIYTYETIATSRTTSVCYVNVEVQWFWFYKVYDGVLGNPTLLFNNISQAKQFISDFINF